MVSKSGTILRASLRSFGWRRPNSFRRTATSSTSDTDAALEMTAFSMHARGTCDACAQPPGEPPAQIAFRRRKARPGREAGAALKVPPAAGRRGAPPAYRDSPLCHGGQQVGDDPLVNIRVLAHIQACKVKAEASRRARQVSQATSRQRLASTLPERCGDGLEIPPRTLPAGRSPCLHLCQREAAAAAASP